MKLYLNWKSGKSVLNIADSHSGLFEIIENGKSSETNLEVAAYVSEFQEAMFLGISKDFSLYEKTELSLEWDKYIKKINDLGFKIFGTKKSQKMKDKQGTYDWGIAFIMVCDKDNEYIIDGDLIITRPKKLKFGFMWDRNL